MKFAFQLAFLLGFGFIQSPVHADTFPANAQTTWAKYFPGQPFITDPENDLERLIQAPESCQARMHDMVRMTVAYGQKAFQSKSNASKKLAENILAYLKKLDDSNDPCFDGIARTYIVSTLHILEPTNVNVGGNITGNRIHGHWIPQGLELTMLGAAFLNQKLSNGQDMVRLLTAKRRSIELSAIWNQRTQDGRDYLVSGGYDCGDRQILIDPFAMPLNMAGTFVHELDHLFRDRIHAPLAGSPREATIQNDIPLAITMDETLASVVAAFYQRHMRFFHDFKPRLLHMVDGIPGLSGYSQPLPFKISNDLTLFRDEKDAPINQIWHLIELGTTPLPDGRYQVNVTASAFLYESFLRGDPNFRAHMIQTAPTEAVHSIYQTIHAGYFENTLLNQTELAELDPSEHGLENDPLSTWLSHYNITTSSNMNETGWRHSPVEWYKQIPASEWDGGTIVGASEIVDIRYTFNDFFAGMDLAMPQILDDPRPSSYCQKYIHGLESGELSTYVGNKFRLGEASVKPGETGVKPGETGVKPGETGVKPGETGVKPGETGVKPGETGVKPGETGVKPSLVKPCLNIQRGL